MKKRMLCLFLAFILAVSLLPVSPVSAEDDEEESRYVQQPTMENGFTVGVNTEGLGNPEISYTWYTKELKPLSDFDFTADYGTVDGNTITGELYDDPFYYVHLTFNNCTFDWDMIYYKLNGVERSDCLGSEDPEFYCYLFEDSVITDVCLTQSVVIPGEEGATLSRYETNCLYCCDVTLNGELLKGEWSKAGYALYYVDGDWFFGSDDRYSAGDQVTLDPEIISSRPDCRLLGWNTAEDGSGTSYEPDGVYTFGNADAILYPMLAPMIIGQPSEENGYTVTVDPYFESVHYQWYRLDDVGGDISNREDFCVYSGSQDGNNIESELFDEEENVYGIDFSLDTYYGFPSTVSFTCDIEPNDCSGELIGKEKDRYTYALNDGYFNITGYGAFSLRDVTYTTVEVTLAEGQNSCSLGFGEDGKRYYCDCYDDSDEYSDHHASSDAVVYTAPKCSRDVPVLFTSLKSGTYRMKFNGVDAGLFELEESQNGYLIRNIESGLYICTQDGAAVMSETPDTVWSKGIASFYVNLTETKKGLFGRTYTAKTRCYLSVEDGEPVLSRTAVTTTLTANRIYEKHLYAYRSLADGTHQVYCLRCGENHTEACTANRLGLCTHCGGANLKRVSSLLAFLQSLKK